MEEAHTLSAVDFSPPHTNKTEKMSDDFISAASLLGGDDPMDEDAGAAAAAQAAAAAAAAERAAAEEAELALALEAIARLERGAGDKKSAPRRRRGGARGKGKAVEPTKANARRKNTSPT